MKKGFRSDLARAKGLGSAKSGIHHWWHQRFTAVFLTIITGWVLCFCWQIAGKQLSEIISIMQKPYNVVMLALFVLISFYHAALGMQVIIEDYITCRVVKISLILFIQIFSGITVVSFIVAILNIMSL